MGVDLENFPETPNPFSAEALRASIARDFALLIPPGRTVAFAAVATPEGARFAVGVKGGDHWQLSVQAGVYHGHMDGSVKLLGAWGDDD